VDSAGTFAGANMKFGPLPKISNPEFDLMSFGEIDKIREKVASRKLLLLIKKTELFLYLNQMKKKYRLCLKVVQNFYLIGFPLSLVFIFINWKISPILFILSIIVQSCNRKLAKRFIFNQCVEDRVFLKFALAVGLVKLEERGRQREPFESYMMQCITANPSISIEEVLEQYIKKHDLAVPHHLDEPAKATAARTKLQILEESSLAKDCDDPQFQNYLNGLRSLVQMFDAMSPEARKLMKEREERGLDLVDQVKKRQVEAPTDREKKIIELEMWDWEIHYRQDLNMFSSMTDFYKFLDTEVQFHAKLDGLDIEKAKEAFISWAEKKHSAEYDKLFMGFFNEILDGKKTISRKELMVRLEGVNFQAAAENIAYTFREATKKAESLGGRFIEMKEFMDATDQYIGKPCLEKAIILLEKYPSWLGLFELTKDPLIIRLRNFKKSKE
jgi:hypothetical protein